MEPLEIPELSLIEVAQAATKATRAEEALARAVDRARDAGMSWDRIGEMAGRPGETLRRRRARSRRAA
jgi:hypothetical protein